MTFVMSLKGVKNMNTLTQEQRINLFNQNQQKMYRDRPYRPLPYEKGLDTTSEKWRRICFAFYIMNQPTFNERRKLYFKLGDSEVDVEIKKIIKFYDDFFGQKTA